MISTFLSTAANSDSAGKYWYMGVSEGFSVNTEEQESIYTTESTGIGGAAEEVGAAAGERFGSTITKISSF